MSFIMTVLIILFSTSLFILITFFILIIFCLINLEMLVMSLGICMFLYIITLYAFIKYTEKYPKNDIYEYCELKITKAVQQKGTKQVILFEKIDGLWVCNYGDRSVVLDLRGYLFQKHFICAYVTRNLRYPLISKKQPMKRLFNYRYSVGREGYSKKTFIPRNVYVELIDGSKKKSFCVVKDGISKNTLLECLITKSRYYSEFLGPDRYRFIKHIWKINEREYEMCFARKK